MTGLIIGTGIWCNFFSLPYSTAEEMMNWFFKTLGTSIGKKLLMAVTGLGFCLFLLGHLAGNLTIYAGKEAFNAYAEHLHSLGPLVTLAELGLLVMALIHIVTGLVLFFQNQQARPVRYHSKQNTEERTLASATMPYTGIIILAFIAFHLLNFHFVDKTDTTIYQIVATAFANPVYVAIYVVVMIIVALHVSHGVWSAFQTLGANHPKYMPMIEKLGLLFSLAIGFGFGLIPLFLLIRVQGG
jgi:succinate dehydrogenase / fumarate reductase cytochrome b subunit